ncbi:hypothetical protein [Croceiramulus getboli]|nr:hypothetical protein P8624_13435 [Flavobacteriaceae bacterium YJPT1-3]
MKNRALSLIFLPLFLSCQDYGKLTIKANLPRTLAEVSGNATVPGSDKLYALNDGGNENHLYALDSLGNIVQELIIAGSKNKDWEDLASDPYGNLYIGDFGNNENDRRKFTIYTVENVLQYQKEIDTAFAKATHFRLPDQEKKPKRNRYTDKDFEALIVYKNNFYIFSKNHLKDFDGTTRVYRIPAQQGEFIAEAMGSFKTCDDPDDCFVTAAALNATQDRLVLLTHDKVFLITQFNDQDFFSGRIQKKKLKHRSQKEGIAFKNDSIVFITDERRAQTGGNLYTFSLQKNKNK